MLLIAPMVLVERQLIDSSLVLVLMRMLVLAVLVRAEAHLVGQRRVLGRLRRRQLVVLVQVACSDHSALLVVSRRHGYRCRRRC